MLGFGFRASWCRLKDAEGKSFYVLIVGLVRSLAKLPPECLRFVDTRGSSEPMDF